MASGKAPKRNKKAKTTPKRRKPPVERVCVLVMGMHRSGTSLLAGILPHMGCTGVATPMPANFANEKGYNESLPIAQFNDKILAQAGSDWKDWRRFNPGWMTSPAGEVALIEAEELLEAEIGQAPLFVLKDPRICRLMPLWKEALRRAGIRTASLHIQRSPLEVAASLSARDAMPKEYALLLWLRNQLEAEQGTRGLSRHFTTYPAVMSNWALELTEASTGLGITWPRMDVDAVEALIEPDLRHFHFNSEQVTGNPLIPEWVRSTFRIFDRWAQQGEDPNDHETLDRILTEFNNTAPAFSTLVQSAMTLRHDLEKTTRALEDAQNRTMVAKQDIETARAESSELTTRFEALKKDQETAVAASAKLTSQMAQDLTDTKKRLTQSTEQIAQLTSERDKARTRVAELSKLLEANGRDMADLKAAQETLNGKLAEAVATNEKAERSKTQAQGEIDKLSRSNTAFAAELAAAQTENTRLKSDLLTSEARATKDAENAAQAIKEAQAEAARQKDAAAQAKTRAEKDAENAAQAIKEAQAEAARQKDTLATVKAQAAANALDAARVEQTLAQAQVDAAQLQDRIMVAEIEAGQEAARTERRLKQAAQAQAKAEEEIETLRLETHVYRETEQAMRDERVQLLSELEQRHSEADYWRDETRKLTDTVTQLHMKSTEDLGKIDFWRRASADLQTELELSRLESDSAIQRLSQKLTERAAELATCNKRHAEALDALRRDGAETVARVRMAMQNKLDKSMARNTLDIHSLRETLAQKDNQMHAQQALIAELTTLVEEMRANKAALESLVASLQKAQADILGTYSWRLTSPLRRIRDML